MSNLLATKYKQTLPGINFVETDRFYWSPKSKSIYFNSATIGTTDGEWALLHEMGHAKCDHKSYKTDLELVKLEVEAWETAKELATALGTEIDDEHIQDCLDSYRDWLHSRSTCPTCGTVSIQTAFGNYRCHNCYEEWTVSKSRFCRSYRMKHLQQKETSSVNVVKQTTFL